MDKQVDKKHYRFSKYSNEERWVSYYYQLKSVLGLDPSSVLEVGVGDKVFANYIRSNTSIMFESLDIAQDLEPDIVGSVLKIPKEDKSVDVTCAFEVLEHIPFSDFNTAIKELGRVAKKAVVLSLPHHAASVKLSIKIPFLKEARWFYKIPRRKNHIFNGQHYWEIGKKGYSQKKIIKELEKVFNIQDHFVPFASQYHHFFVLKPRD